MAGIFGTVGAWWLGFDFCQEGVAVPTTGILSFNNPGGQLVAGTAYARYQGKGVQAPDIPTSGTIAFNTNLTTFYSGFAYKCVNLPAFGGANCFCTIFDLTGNAPKLNLTVNSSGQLQCYTAGGLFTTGGTTVSSTIGNPSATGVIANGAYNFIEIKYTHSASGIIQIICNGATVISFTGSTLNGGNAFFNSMILGSKTNGSINYFDDWYILDGTGAAPFNTFLGNGRCDTAFPSGDSATAGLNQWAATTPQGTDYGNASNNPPNVAQYNSAATSGLRMSLTFPGITTSKVLGLNLWWNGEQDAAGTTIVTPQVRSNLVDASGNAVTLTGAYVYSNQRFLTDPNTGLGWNQGTVAAAASAELGLTRTT